MLFIDLFITKMYISFYYGSLILSYSLNVINNYYKYFKYWPLPILIEELVFTSNFQIHKIYKSLLILSGQELM